jgi:hypothetical protein
MEIDLAEPYQSMLDELRESAESDPDADIRRLVEDAIHSGYQQLPDDR